MIEKKKKYLLGISLLITVLFVIGISYAIWSLTLTQESTNIITTGCFQIEFQDNNPINLQNAYPISDEEGSKLTPYTFTITNTCDSIVSYQVNLEILNTTTLTKLDIINTKLNENILILTSELEVEKTLENAESSYKLEIGSLKAQETKSFELRLWMDEDTPTIDEVMNKTFESKITITVAHQKNMYIEPLLKGMDPVLKEELIPITIENDGTVRKANTEEKWYSYENKEWANAVILKDESINYQNNEIIPEDNIESYFVWIPKYRYQLWDLGNYNGLTAIDESKIHTIPVIFGDYNTRDEVDGECTTPMESGASGFCQVGDYMTHPAFLSIPSNGFWVGKFETSKSNSNADNSINPEGVQIKPNVVSWRNIQVANAFYTTYDYKRNLDSHMMKNTEWGAVAYLQHSEYGSHEGVRINNNSSYLTGYASVSEPTCGLTTDNSSCNQYGTASNITLPYNTDTGYLSSTTGNITGIYDLSGGAWEYVMSIMIDSKGNFVTGHDSGYHSQFNGTYGIGGSFSGGLSLPQSKYYDIYNARNNYNNYSRGHLGDAMNEIGPFKDITSSYTISSWYNDYAHSAHLLFPWFLRGGVYTIGSASGVFAFSYTSGVAYQHGSFRLVLTPTVEKS